jgi:hypothetical protein
MNNATFITVWSPTEMHDVGIAYEKRLLDFFLYSDVRLNLFCIFQFM